MKFLLILVLTCMASVIFAQDECDKCSMLREEYDLATGSKKEELYIVFKDACLETQKIFVSEEGVPADSSKAESYQVIAYGKCIPYREVMQYDKASNKITASYKIDKDTIYSVGTKTPNFPGGDTELVKFLSANLKNVAQKPAMPVTVYARFVVRKNGKISDVKITRSSTVAYNEEAIRVIKSMPSWIPGEFKGKPVDMYYTIPVRFSSR